MIYGFLRPHLEVVRSEIAPIKGSLKAFHKDQKINPIVIQIIFNLTIVK